MQTEQDLDEAIDRAVRDIMGVDPRPGLRARVLRRLERPERTWLSLPQLAAAAALIVIVVAAVLMTGRGPEPQVSPMVAKREPASIHLPAPAKPALAPTDRERGSIAAAGSRTASRPVFPPQGRVAAANIPGDATSPPQSVAPDAAAPAAEPPRSELAPKPIVIDPLTIPPIVIPPIRPPR